ncbi:MAG: eCIS core domain-containing protein [Phycisphaerales bacterium]
MPPTRVKSGKLRAPAVVRAPATTPAAARPARAPSSGSSASRRIDHAESEARTVARRVMSSPAPAGATARSPYTPRALPTASGGSGGGTPLPPSVRAFMEPRFGASFAHVRVHTGPQATAITRAQQAKAVTIAGDIHFAPGTYDPDSTKGRELLAHELAHTVQQGATQAVAAGRATAAPVTARVPRGVQRLGISDVLDYFAEKAHHIPGFGMLCFALGFNPINGEDVPRTAANLLRAAVELIPGGALIAQALNKYGVFERAGAWLTAQIEALSDLGTQIKADIDRFIDNLSWTDIFHLGRVWDNAKALVARIVGRVVQFVLDLVGGILDLIRDAVLAPIAALAQGTRGYPLLCAVLGRDPITGNPVPRNAETLVGGFMILIGQTEVWENIKRSNAIARAFAWVQGAISGLVSLVSSVPERFLNALRSLEITDLLVLPRGLAKIVGVFVTLVADFLAWAGNALWNLLEIIFDVVSPGALAYVKRTGSALRSIFRDPIPFVRNLVAAGKLGFQRFRDRIGTHFQNALLSWLRGMLPGIYIPTAFTLVEFLKMALSVLGISWTNIRQKLVTMVGEPAVRVLETSVQIVATLVRDGPAAAWEQMKEQLATLQTTIISGITQFVVEQIVRRAVPRLLSMFIPGLGFITAILSIYDTIMVFVRQISRIIEVVRGFVDSIVSIAAGNITTAATRVESALASALILAVAFFAGILRLDRIGARVMEIIGRVRAVVDRGITRVCEWIVSLARRAAAGVKNAAGRILEWWRSKVSFAADGESHSLYFAGDASDPQLTLASKPTPIGEFIAVKSAEKGSTPAKTAALKALKALAAEVAKTTTKLKAAQAKEATAPKRVEELAKELSTHLNAMAPHIAVLLSRTSWGTKENPLPLEYTKRPAAAYPVIYVGPRSDKMIRQEYLRTGNRAKINELIANPPPGFPNRWDTEPITALRPTTTTQLSTGKTVGITSNNQVSVGHQLIYNGKRDARGSENKINKALAAFGYSPSEDAVKLDGDHVVELQIGGKDELENLWPLNSKENQTSGGKLRGTKVHPPGSPGPMTLAAAYTLFGKEQMFIVIIKVL